MNLLFIFLSIVFLFLLAFGGTILGKLVEDYKAYKRQDFRKTW
jgi:hypothetical protein